jgi:hypothetical protein
MSQDEPISYYVHFPRALPRQLTVVIGVVRKKSLRLNTISLCIQIRKAESKAFHASELRRRGGQLHAPTVTLPGMDTH